MGEVRYNDHSERHQRAFLYKKIFFPLVEKREVPYSLNNSGFPFYICSRAEFFKTFHFEMQEPDSIRAYCQQLLRCAALLLLLRPRDGVADNNHTN